MGILLSGKIIDVDFSDEASQFAMPKGNGKLTTFVFNYGQQVAIPITGTVYGSTPSGEEIIIGEGSAILTGELRGELSDFPAAPGQYTITLSEFVLNGVIENSVDGVNGKVFLRNLNGDQFYSVPYTIELALNSEEFTYDIKYDDGTIETNVTKNRMIKV